MSIVTSLLRVNDEENLMKDFLQIDKTAFKGLTHRDNEGSVTGVLLHPAAQRLRRRRYRIPVTERPIVPVCNLHGGSAVALTMCVNEALFL